MSSSESLPGSASLLAGETVVRSSAGLTSGEEVGLAECSSAECNRSGLNGFCVLSVQLNELALIAFRELGENLQLIKQSCHVNKKHMDLYGYLFLFIYIY